MNGKKKNGKTKKNAGTCWDKKEKATQVKMIIKLEEINQRVLVKEGRLKRYWDSKTIQRKKGHSKTIKGNSIK